MRGLGLFLGLYPPGGSTGPTKWGVDASGNWETASNWKPAKVPTAKTAVLVGPGITAPRVLTLTAPGAIKSLAFNSAFSHTVAGLALTVGMISATGGGSPTISAPIAGTTLTKSGDGTLTLSGANTYSGATIISAGTLAAGSAGAIPATSVVSGAGTLDISGFDTTVAGIDGPMGVTLGAKTLTINCAGTCAYTGLASGTGGLTKSGAGVLTVTGASLYSGPATVSAGTLVMQGAAFSAAPRTYSIASGAVLNLDGGADVAVGSTTIDGAGTLRISGGFFGSTQAARDLALSLDAGGTIDIQSGATVLNGGFSNLNWSSNLATLNVDGTLDAHDGSGIYADALTGAGSITKGSGAGSCLFTIGANNGSGTFSGTIADAVGTIAITKTGTGTQTLSGLCSYIGNTTINAGTLKLGIANWNSLTDIVLADVASATFDLAGFSQTVASLYGGGPTGGTVTSTGGACTLTFGDADSDTFGGRIRDGISPIKVGAGAYTWTGANDFTGTLAINVGSLIAGANNVIPSTCAITTANTAGVSLNIGATTQSVRSIAGGGSTGGGLVIAAGGTFTINNTSSTSFSGLVSGAGNLTHSGTAQFTIALSSTLSGTVTIGGSATLSGAATSATGLGPMVLNSGAILKKDTNARTFNNSIYTFQPGTVTLDPNTAGTLTLATGLPTFAGNVTVDVPQGQVSLSGLLAESGGSGYDLIKTGLGELKINAASATRTGNVYILAGRMASGSTSAWTTAGTIFLGDTSGSNSAEIGLTTGSNPRALTVRAGSSGQKIMTRNSNNPTLAGALTLNDDLRLNTGAGAFTFSGTATGTGGLRLITSAGSLAWSAATKSGWTGSIYGDSGSTTVTISGGATGASGTAAITTVAAFTGTIFCNSAFSGTGAAVIGGGGLGGTSSYGGAVTIQSGARIIGGSGASNAGTFTVNGNLTLDSGATITVNIGSVTTVGKITTLGNLTLNGNIPTLQATALNAGTYPLFNYSGTLVGTLGAPVLTGTGRTFSNYTYGAGVVSITLHMINFDPPITGQFVVNGTAVTTTFNAIEPCERAGEYHLLWVLDNDGQPQVTCNGTTAMTDERYSALLSANPNDATASET